MQARLEAVFFYYYLDATAGRLQYIFGFSSIGKHCNTFFNELFKVLYSCSVSEKEQA